MSNSTQVYFTTVLFPQSYRSFIVLISLLVAHVALVVAILVDFSINSRHTLLTNHWQSIAQFCSGEIQSLLTSSTTSTDEEFRARLVQHGFSDRGRVKLETIQDESRITILHR